MEPLLAGTGRYARFCNNIFNSFLDPINRKYLSPIGDPSNNVIDLNEDAVSPLMLKLPIAGLGESKVRGR